MVLDLLQIPFDAKEDVRMNELMRLAHQFLQNFCLGNQNNQVSGQTIKYLLTFIQVYDLILSCYIVLGAASQTFRAFHEPRPARGENHVCNISGQFAKRILARKKVDMMS